MQEIKSYQEQINDLMEQYSPLKNDPAKVHKINDIIFELNKIAFELAFEYHNQCVIGADNKSIFDHGVSQKEEAYMKMASYNNKKMTSAYAKTLSEQEYRGNKKAYTRAQGIEKGLDKLLFQIGTYKSDMKMTINLLMKDI